VQHVAAQLSHQPRNPDQRSSDGRDRRPDPAARVGHAVQRRVQFCVAARRAVTDHDPVRIDSDPPGRGEPDQFRSHQAEADLLRGGDPSVHGRHRQQHEVFPE
jgi:hypothetical protein